MSLKKLLERKKIERIARHKFDLALAERDLSAAADRFDTSMVAYFNIVRKTRHAAVYDRSDCVSEETAREVISKAKEFVHKIRTIVHKIRTGRSKDV